MEICASRSLLKILPFVAAFMLCNSPSTAADTADSCLACHASAAKMTELGYPHFTVTQNEVETQSGMTAGCADCHLGNRLEGEREKAHQGMGRLLLIRKKGLVAETAERKLPLEIGGNAMLRLKYQVAKDGKPVIDPGINNLLYQDKRRDTLSQDFAFMEKSCGACHKREFAEFRKSTMGRNAKQSRYRSWTDKDRGPHNCGVWFEGNREKIAANTPLPLSSEVSALNQRACNTCHVGCLDCHYEPMASDPADPKKGMHTFNRTPKSESCYGGGRGALCHAGPEDRRRGAGYFGGPFSHPEGMEADVHLAKNVGCLDCHESTKTNRQLGHGMVRRQAECIKCHQIAMMSHARSVHSRLSCEACHIRNVAGYQATFWGPGKLAGMETPFFKYKDYYGIMKEPILIRDQSGRWIPVKPYPMAVLNQKKSALKPGLHWRWPKNLPAMERTDDAWGYVGLVGGLPENNKALLWIQMDKLSHKYGRSRECGSCHDLPGGEQRQEVTWEFSDAGAMPFKGSHTVVAAKNGLFIKGLKAGERIEVNEGYRLSSLAPFVYLQDKWFVKGDFSIPRIKDMKRYRAVDGDPKKARSNGMIHQ